MLNNQLHIIVKKTWRVTKMTTSNKDLISRTLVNLKMLYIKVAPSPSTIYNICKRYGLNKLKERTKRNEKAIFNVKNR